MKKINEDLWYEFKRTDFEIENRKCILVKPQKPAAGNPWIWRARFWGVEPQTERALLAKGFHVAFIDVSNLYGSPKAVSLWNKLYAKLVKDFHLSKKPVLEGFSRGGLIVYNWAKLNPEKVSCIYADAPVCDIKSWPAGKGSYKGSEENWRLCGKAYNMTEEELLAYNGNPIDNLEPLAEAGIRLLHICGDADSVVPMRENTDILLKRYRELGGDIKLIVKKGCEHHPHSLKDPTPIVEFILKNTEPFCE